MLYMGSDIAGSNDSGSGAGEWRWTDGSAVSFTAWAVGEPNDSGGNQDCGVMRWGASVEEDWDDLGCAEARPFICQGTPAADPLDTGVSEPTEMDCTEEEYEGLVTLFCNTSRTWAAAHDECRARGLDLVSIHSAEEQEWLYARIEEISPSGGWFIGLREQESLGAVDEVCIYNELLDAGEMERLGAQEDCVTVLEPLPPEPVDTGELDTGMEDSGEGAADGDSPSDPESEEEGDTAESDPAAPVSKDGCSCASTARPGTWSWAVLLGLLLGVRRRVMRVDE